MSNRTVGIKTQPQFDRSKNGSLYDRGCADSYYRRKRNPHWYPMGTYKGKEVTDLTPEEIKEYNVGFNDNEKTGFHKEWD